MPTWLSLSIDAALIALCLACLRLGPGFGAWPRTDKISYLVLVGAVWPWLIARDLTQVPLWYTVAVIIAGGGAWIAFALSQARFLRQSKAELDQISAWAEQHLGEQNGDRP